MTHRTPLILVKSFLGLGLLISSCRGSRPIPEGALPIEVEKVEMLQLESFPVQLVLHVEGWLPNPCSSAAWEISDSSASEIEITLYAVPDGAQACIQVLAPFSVNIPLGALSPEAQILLNGEPVGTS